MVSMRVGNIMRREVVWVTPGTTIAEASQLMLDKGVRSLVVCNEDERVVGIVTDTDIISRAIGKCNLFETTVEKIMTKDPVTTHPDADVLEIVKVMGERRFRRMPVINEKKKLIGIISIGDIAPQLMIQLELLRGTL
jgi:CBS domain-containing protein